MDAYVAASLHRKFLEINELTYETFDYLPSTT